jgi:hypothetical protein
MGRRRWSGGARVEECWQRDSVELGRRRWRWAGGSGAAARARRSVGGARGGVLAAAWLSGALAAALEL